MRIFGIIMLIIFALLLSPVKLEWVLSDQQFLALKYTFFRIQLVPKKEKKPKAKKEKPATKEKPEKEKKPKDEGKSKEYVELAIKVLFDLNFKLLAPIKKLLRRTTVAKLQLKIVVKGSDSAQTAIKFGQYNGAVYSALTIVDKIIRVKVKDIDIVPGFEPRVEEFYSKGELRVIPLAAVVAAVQLLITTVMSYSKVKKQMKNTKQSQRKDDENVKREEKSA